MRCLVIDDDLAANENAASALKEVAPDIIKIDEILSAYNIEQAKDIIKQYSVDLVLCDIEMPMGSGLEFIKWLRDNNINIECIFLTCFADFDYIKNAVKYGCADYLLKPLNMSELNDVMRKVVARLKNRKRELRQERQNLLRELIDCFDYSAKVGCEKLSQHGLFSNEPSETYFPILFSVKYRPVQYLDWPSGSLKFVLLNVINEVVNLHEEDIFISLSKNKYALLLYKSDRIPEQIVDCLNYIVQWFQNNLEWKILTYVNPESETAYAVHIIRKMLNMDEEFLQQSGCIQYNREYPKYLFNNSSRTLAFLILLEEGRFHEFQREWNHFFSNALNSKSMSMKSLEPMVHAIIQFLYYILGQRRLFSEIIIKEEVKKLDDNYYSSGKSLDAALQYIDYLVQSIIEAEGETFDRENICQKVKQYILQNIDRELSHRELGDYFHLNSDYLNRVFKKEEGETLTQYAINKKMEMAKELLMNTNLSVKTIGEKVGYNQYTYFASSFKKYTGLTPMEYRDKSVK